MKIVLITGLDGSGKSTLIQKIENSHELNRSAVLRVPEIDVEVLKSNQELYDVACFINGINKRADEEGLPQLKLLALFFSMVVFRDILLELAKGDITTIFCERHPVVDTSVYGQFYFKLFDRNKFQSPVFREIEQMHAEHLKFIIKRVTAIEAATDCSCLDTLIDFLDQWFVKGKKYSAEHLKTLFAIDLPDKVYYLKANAGVLMSRIEQRARREAHETEAILNAMIPLYDDVFATLNTKVEVVDATNFENLDIAFAKIKQALTPPKF